MLKKKEQCFDSVMETHDVHCLDSSCVFCLMKEPNLDKRQSLLTRYFNELPSQQAINAGQLGFAVTGLWSFAMAQPNNADLVEVGVLECMASLIWKGIHNRRWLLQDQNISVPYYAAHVIGSYTMNREDFAERAVKEGVIPPLIELMRGRLTWVEQRVAVRALGHLASYSSTFLSVAVQGGGEVLELAMELAVCSLEIVYTHFMQFEEKRLKYHRDLLTKRVHGGGRGRANNDHEMEARKAEEWASQLQCWSLQLINCFAFKEKYIPTICRPSFLSKLPDMWGGLANEDSPAGLGLLRTICQHKLGRTSVAACPSVVQALRRISRSSDDWQYMAVECLLVLLQDTKTRQRVMDMAAVPLVDMAEMPCFLAGSRRKLGEEIVDTLLQDDTQSPSAFLRGTLSSRSRRLLDELASYIQRTRWEKSLSKHELLARQQLALDLKLQGNACFSEGDVQTAAEKYSEALRVCPCKAKKERIVLCSNRAQCHLLLQDAESAISDTTRALCLARPLNCHAKSLWRRAQAYEMMGLTKESLLDAIMFINECTHMAEKNASLLNQPAVPDYAELLVKKQMKEAWLFKEAALKHGPCEQSAAANSSNEQGSNSNNNNNNIEAPSSSSSSISTIATIATRITGMVGTEGRPGAGDMDIEDAAARYRDQSAEEDVEGDADSDWEGAGAGGGGSSEGDIIIDDEAIHNISKGDANFAYSEDAASTVYTPASSHHRYAEQARFTPRSRKFLHSFQQRDDDRHHQARSNIPPAAAHNTKVQQPPLLPTIREEINKHQACPGPIDTELLKKSIFDLIQQNLSLDRTNSSDKFSR